MSTQPHQVQDTPRAAGRAMGAYHSRAVDLGGLAHSRGDAAAGIPLAERGAGAA